MSTLIQQLTEELLTQTEHSQKLEAQVRQIMFLFEEKIKTSEANIAHLKKHRDHAYATGHLVESYDRELARLQEKYNTLVALYQEVCGAIGKPKPFKEPLEGISGI